MLFVSKKNPLIDYISVKDVITFFTSFYQNFFIKIYNEMLAAVLT